MPPVLKEINLGRDGDAVHTIIEYYCLLSPSHAATLLCNRELYGEVNQAVEWEIGVRAKILKRFKHCTDNKLILSSS